MEPPKWLAVAAEMAASVVGQEIDDGEIGTTRWFGETWNAPVNDPRAQMPTPVGAECIYCPWPIEAGDRGVATPWMDGPRQWAYIHLACFLRSIGAPVE